MPLVTTLTEYDIRYISNNRDRRVVFKYLGPNSFSLTFQNPYAATADRTETYLNYLLRQLEPAFSHIDHRNVFHTDHKVLGSEYGMVFTDVDYHSFEKIFENCPVFIKLDGIEEIRKEFAMYCTYVKGRDYSDVEFEIHGNLLVVTAPMEYKQFSEEVESVASKLGLKVWSNLAPYKVMIHARAVYIENAKDTFFAALLERPHCKGIGLETLPKFNAARRQLFLSDPLAVIPASAVGVSFATPIASIAAGGAGAVTIAVESIAARSGRASASSPAGGAGAVTIAVASIAALSGRTSASSSAVGGGAGASSTHVRSPST